MKSFIIAFKDLKTQIKDTKAIILSLLMPIILTAILGFALKDMLDTDHASKTIIGLYTQGQDQFTNQFVEEVLQSDALKKSVVVKPASTEAELTKWLQKEKVDVGLTLPKNWGKQIHTKQDSTALIQVREDKKFEAGFIQQITDSYVSTVKTIFTSTEVAMTNLAERAMKNGSAVNMDQAVSVLTGRLENIVDKQAEFIKDQPIGKTKVSSLQYYAAAMAAMFLLFTAMTGGKSFHHERSTETLTRLLMTPTSPSVILFGKFLGSFFFAFVQFMVFMIATRFVLGVNWGDDLLQTITIALAYSFAVGGLAMIIAAITANEKMADTVGSIGVQVFAILGGSMLPLSMFPEALRKLSSITPNSWALQSFTNIMSGVTWSELFTPIMVLIGFGLVSMILGIARLRIRY